MSILNILQLLSIDGVRKGGNENLEGVQEDKEVKKFYKKWKFWIIFIFIVLLISFIPIWKVCSAPKGCAWINFWHILFEIL